MGGPKAIEPRGCACAEELQPAGSLECEALERPRDRGFSSLFRDERGAAYTEAVIMLPVFFMVFALFYHVHRVHTAKLETLQNARSSAWLMSYDDCEGSSTCPSGRGECASADSDSGVDSAISDLKSKLGPFEGAIGGFLDGIFGTATKATATSSYSDPNYLGGSDHNLSTSYAIMCNPKRVTILDMLKTAFCDAISPLC
ncbi:MAG: hypothetical protein OEY14_06060 [Myxococcales bacterium]|nr:hypothetical protein [Myxococcales bacterium]